MTINKFKVDSETIKRQMARYGLSEKKLCEKAGISEETLTKALHFGYATYRTLCKIAFALETIPEEMLFDQR